MNRHILLQSAGAAVATASPDIFFHTEAFESATLRDLARRLDFKKIRHEDMPLITPYIMKAPGRTTDFSYAGLLMWVDYFNYEYAIICDTLFIKGKVESDITKTAFSLPLGRLPLSSSVAILKEYCNMNSLQLEFSAVPECAIADFSSLRPARIELLTDWSDYLYNAEDLATLKGKRYGKKRNHVNQFMATFPKGGLEPLTLSRTAEALRFMDRMDAEGDDTPMAVAERKLNRAMLNIMAERDDFMEGALLTDGNGEILGFTIGDIKGDTLFIHIEKALRDAPGAFETLNKEFAALMLSRHPELRYINREDDAGDPGLRRAKESYHPVALLKKFNVVF